MTQYGPQANDARALLRQLIETRLERGWALEASGEHASGSGSVYQEFPLTGS